MSKFKKLVILFALFFSFIFVSQTVLSSSQGGEPIGKLMFALGKVSIIGEDGNEKRVRRGEKIYQGDLVKTNNNGQAQIKFKDGARISIRSNSEFRVDAYVYDTNLDKSQYKSELSLLRGGLRSITGAIGKSNKKSYKMKTVVATIGIRGTDYSLMLCEQNCKSYGGSVNSGLYVGVVNGGVTLKNDAGNIDVSPNQYAMVGSSTAIPIMLLEPPSFLMFDKTAATQSERSSIAKAITKQRKEKLKNSNASKKSNNVKLVSTKNTVGKVLNERYSSTTNVANVAQASTDINDDNVGYNSNSTNDPLVANVEFVSANNVASNLPESNLSRFFNFIFGDTEAQNADKITQLDSDNVSNIYQLDGRDESLNGYIEYTDGSDKPLDFGYDSSTGLSWGRWSSVNVKQTEDTAGLVTDASATENQSLHWIMGAEVSDTIDLPITGQRNFVLIGNTNPTNNFGNVGILGSASLTANFDTQTVDAGINLSIDQQVWQGSNESIPLDMRNGQFNDTQLLVNVTGGTNTGGSISGGLLNGAVNSAGFTYSMDANIDGELNQVTGAAAFKEVP